MDDSSNTHRINLSSSNKVRKINNPVDNLSIAFFDCIKNNKGEELYKASIPKHRKFLKKEGFRTRNNELIRIVNKVAEKVTPDIIFQHGFKHIESYKNPKLEAEYIKQFEPILLKNKGVLLLLKECKSELLKDNEITSYHSYQNGVVAVSREQIEVIKFSKISGFVWKELIVNRKFKILNEHNYKNCVFGEYIKKITDGKKHFLSIMLAIGYQLNGHKDQRKPIVIILNDQNLNNEGKSMGGTGKGLLVKAIAQIIPTLTLNGKNLNLKDNRFIFQNVNEFTRVIVLDDVSKNFNFEDIYSLVSENMIVEKKNKTAFVFLFSESPKFLITTNYTIKGDTSSSKRRRFDVFLNDHFSAEHTPNDEFKHEFFVDWDDEEWGKFDFFMMSCLKYYLSSGLIKYDTPELKLKIFKSETSPDFLELMQQQFDKLNIKYSKSDVKNIMICEYGNKYKFLEQNHSIIKDWVTKYSELKDWEVIHGRNSNGATFRFKKSV